MLYALWSLAGCAHSTPAEKKQEQNIAAAAPSIEAKQVAAEEQAPFVAELTFSKNKHQLSKTSRARIDKLLAEAKRQGEISEIKVISWADEEYPSVHTKKLSTDQRSLAEHRNNAIKKYLQHGSQNVEVSAYNMAERPGVLSDLISTSNSRIKKAFEVAGIPNTDTSVKTPAKASKSIVMILLK